MSTEIVSDVQKPALPLRDATTYVQMKNCDLPSGQLTKRRPTQGVVRLQVPAAQFEEALHSLQRHFGLQDAVEHPGKGVEWDDQHSHQSQCGEHLQGGDINRRVQRKKKPTHKNTSWITF